MPRVALLIIAIGGFVGGGAGLFVAVTIVFRYLPNDILLAVGLGAFATLGLYGGSLAWKLALRS